MRRNWNNVTAKVFLPTDAREALDAYIAGSRQAGEGPLFRSRNGRRLARQNVDAALKRIAAQANARIPEERAISLSPHDLRHTALRKMAEKKGIRHAQQIAGHASSKYIWRYVAPTTEEIEDASESLYG